MEEAALERSEQMGDQGPCPPVVFKPAYGWTPGHTGNDERRGPAIADALESATDSRKYWQALQDAGYVE